MARRLVALILLISILFIQQVFAEDDGLSIKGSASKIITAYKNRISEDVPDPYVELRLLNNSSVEFTSGAELQIPLNYRQTDYSIVQWVLGGNVYGEVTVEYTFAPMFRAKNENDEYIPYTVSLVHNYSRIGNTTIPEGRESQATSLIQCNFEDCYFKFADSAVVSDSSKTITNVAQSISIVYDMSKYTKVYDSNNGDYDYNKNVCNYWNRNGNIVTNIQITDDGYRVGSESAFSEGTYYSYVVVSVSMQ